MIVCIIRIHDCASLCGWIVSATTLICLKIGFPKIRRLPSGNLLHSYWKWPRIVDFPIKNGVFHGYVSLPEGNHIFWILKLHEIAIWWCHPFSDTPKYVVDQIKHVHMEDTGRYCKRSFEMIDLATPTMLRIVYIISVVRPQNESKKLCSLMCIASV